MPKNNSKARRDIRAGEAKTRQEESRARETARLLVMYKQYMKTFPDERLEEVADAFGVLTYDNWRYDVVRQAWAEVHAPRRAELPADYEEKLQRFRGWDTRGHEIYA